MPRPLNGCRDCGRTWHPKGQDISVRCPSCKGSRVYLPSGLPTPAQRPSATSPNPASSSSLPPVVVNVAPSVNAVASVSATKRSKTLRVTASLVLLGAVAYAGKDLILATLSSGTNAAALGGTFVSVMPAEQAPANDAEAVRVDLDALRSRHPTETEHQYGHKRLLFRATLVGTQAPRALLFAGEPTTLCQVASGQPFPPYQPMGTEVEVRGTFRGADSQGFHFHECRITSP